MKKGFFDRVENNAAVRTWAEMTQREKGDSLAEGYVSELWDFTRVSVTQNNLQELKEIWDQWNNKARQLFYLNYGDLPYLLDMKIDKRLFRALAYHFWKVDKVLYRVFSESYSPLKEIVATPMRDDISEEKWMAIF
ncbi:hypothetical protein Goklo_024852 [Gossypium klotzschianum]|uniref:Uncharacterized protein n=1 Tax=Gossypium klotzschianum TaxID=34286 RepID=A0A7J8W7F5_9ROSI|nr:hypothetical protein [Gossypium klotzschianum]